MSRQHTTPIYQVTSTAAKRVEKKGTLYRTDPDARLMRSNNGGGDISHNVLIAVEDKMHLVIAVDVTSESTDYKQLFNMASKAKEELQVDEITAIADKGYYSAEEFEYFSSRHEVQGL